MNEPPMDLAPNALPGLKPLIADVSLSVSSLSTHFALSQLHPSYLANLALFHITRSSILAL